MTRCTRCGGDLNTGLTCVRCGRNENLGFDGFRPPAAAPIELPPFCPVCNKSLASHDYESGDHCPPSPSSSAPRTPPSDPEFDGMKVTTMQELQVASVAAEPRRNPTDAELPPHTKDFGAPGNPAAWCERCRIEQLRAQPAPQVVPQATPDALPTLAECLKVLATLDGRGKEAKAALVTTIHAAAMRGREDAKRLDWLEAQIPTDVAVNIYATEDGKTIGVFCMAVESKGPSLRAALDDGRHKSSGQRPCSWCNGSLVAGISGQKCKRCNGTGIEPRAFGEGGR